MSAATAISSRFSAEALPNLSFRGWATVGSIVLSDSVAFAASAFAAVLMRYALGGKFVPSEYLRVTPAILLFPIVFAFFGLYPGIASNPVEEFQRILAATGCTYLLIIGATFLQKDSAWLSRAVFVTAGLLCVVLVMVGRAVTRGWCARKSWWGVPAVILGSGRAGMEMLELLRHNPALGLRPIGLLDFSHFNIPESSRDEAPIVTGSLSLAPVLARRYRDCYAIVAMPDLSCQELAVVVSDYAEDFPHVFVIPDLVGLSTLMVSARHIGGTLGLEVKQTLTHRLPLFLKRCCDLVLGAIAGIVTLPIVAAACIAIRFTSPGPLFYGQRRVGRNDQTFVAWKFRTMVSNAAEELEFHLASDPELRQEWDRDHKLKNDPRVTPVGRFLRKTSLDELPQIWNVFRGEMSLVGPRPIVTAEIAKYGKRFDLYRKVPPGITGLWQVSGRNQTTYEARTEFDEYYVRNWSICLDLYILFRTVKAVLNAEGAY